MLTILALALLAGAQTVNDIHRTGLRLSQTQRRSIGLRRKKHSRFDAVPGYDLYRDLLAALDLDVFAAVLNGWLQTHAGRLPKTLVLDGKTVRDLLGCIIGLVDPEDGVPVALKAAPGKGHELTQAQALLALVIPDLRPVPEFFATVIARPAYALQLLHSR